MSRFVDEAIIISLDEHTRVVIPQIVSPVLDAGAMVNVVLPVFPHYAATLAAALRSGSPFSATVGPSLATVTIDDKWVTWDIDDDDSGWLSCDDESFRSATADAVAAIPFARADMACADTGIDVALAMVALNGLSAQRGRVVVERDWPEGELDCVYRYRIESP